MFQVFLAVDRFFSWLGERSLADLFSSHRIEVRLLRDQIQYERNERIRERNVHEELRAGWEVERLRLENRLMLVNRVPPLFNEKQEAQVPPQQRKGTLQKADERTRAKVEADKARMVAWLSSAAAYRAASQPQQENQTNGDAEPEEAEETPGPVEFT